MILTENIQYIEQRIVHQTEQLIDLQISVKNNHANFQT